MQGIPGRSENDDMMIRFHHCLRKLYKGKKTEKVLKSKEYDAKDNTFLLVWRQPFA